MSAAGDALATAAARLVGTPFRLHGREPQAGLDCVGLVAAAMRATGRRVQAPAGYRLRQQDPSPWLRAAEEAGLVPAGEPLEPGDVLLSRTGPAQHHLLIASAAGGFVHAHAGLRRVVHSPAPLPWPVVRRWRVTE